MNTRELKQLYHNFFESRGHSRIPSAPLLPENDPTVLFTPAGMQPLVPFLLGERHPQGKRLVNVQRCIRTVDIDEVGDRSHLTFFEMLGNWSLGDYFKQESLSWSYEFLTSVLGISPDRLAVTVFSGDETAPRDTEAASIWRGLGMPEERIYFLPKADNWWGPVGSAGPCGPDSEIFFDTGGQDHPGCRPGCPCGRWVEIWNNVFMEYNQTSDGQLLRLPQRNVDTGMGVERTVLALSGHTDIFAIETLRPLVEQLEALSGCSYSANPRPFRIISDHLRAVTFALADGAVPGNVEAGYVVRRMIRRAVLFGRDLGIKDKFCSQVAQAAIELFQEDYPVLAQNREKIFTELEREETKFQRTLERGLREYRKVADRALQRGAASISGAAAFNLFETFGFPLALTVELAKGEGIRVDEAGFERLYAEHRERSRQNPGGKFKGGLADATLPTARLHTATHLLHSTLRRILGPEVRQMGSNITPERLRFDFTHPTGLTDQEIEAVEQLVNSQIEADLPVVETILPLKEALDSGALAFFGDRYGDLVKVYSIGEFSKEICGGPHASRTGELGSFKIIKQEAVGQGVRRLRAVLQDRE